MKTRFPAIELLEARIAPAALIVTTTADSGNGSLRAALQQADQHFIPGKIETIVFKLTKAAPGTENMISLTSGALTSKGNIDIVGPGPGKLIINAGGNSRVFDINDGSDSTLSPATISGLSIIGGYSSTYGGGINSSETLTLKNVVISGNKSQADGGGVEVYSKAPDFAGVTITGSLITGNTSSAGTNPSNGGGGLGLENVGSLKISNSVIVGNSASGYHGGGAFISTASTAKSVSITGTQITGNSAGAGGGLFAFDSATTVFSITGCNISGNTATLPTSGYSIGGGVYLRDGHFAFTNSTISNNVAQYGGGGIAGLIGNGSLAIKGSTISGNMTVKTQANAGSGGRYFQGGGGIYLYAFGGGTLIPASISGSKILDNRDGSAGGGGGLSVYGGINLALSASTFSGNSALNGGGVCTHGVTTAKVNLTIAKSVFSANNARNAGGGMDVSGDGTFNIASSKVMGNTASQDAGIRANSGSSLTMKNTSITGNSVIAPNSSDAYYCGGLYISDTQNFLISGGIISGNHANDAGGAAFFDSSGSIKGTIITGNTALSFAGGLANGGDNPGEVTIQVSKVFGNSAPVSPDLNGTFLYA